MKNFDIYIYPKEEIYFEYLTDYTGTKKIEIEKEDLLNWLNKIHDYKIIRNKSKSKFNYKNITGLKYEIDTDKKQVRLYFLYNKEIKELFGINKYEKEYNLHNEEEKIKFDKYLYKLLKIKKEDNMTELPNTNTEQEINDKYVEPQNITENDESDGPDEPVPPLVEAEPPLVPAGKKRKTHKRKHNKKRRKTTKKR